ncbi:MAG: hypothetical protein HY719_12340 [Planctomycetes bacterium]|nr:hypothetical protein [Planctomycetota bacterium]
MNRTEFEVLRDLPGKVIRGDVSFSKGRKVAPLLVAEDVRIENAHEVDARLTITYNPEVGSVNFNVHMVSVGPICRLDVRGPAHRPAGRRHKHALQTDRRPDRNLPDGVVDRPDLLTKSIEDLFHEFCRMGAISHVGGVFHSPEDVAR